MRNLGLGLATAILASTPALAVDVGFTGTVVNTCSVLAATDGLLALNIDGDILSSIGTVGGLPGTVTILSIGTNTIEVSAPQRTAAPVGYAAAGEEVEVAYFGLSGLSLINQPFTPSTTSFDPATIAASVLTVNTRIVNPNGFAAGNYATRTTVTCVP